MSISDCAYHTLPALHEKKSIDFAVGEQLACRLYFPHAPINVNLTLSFHGSVAVHANLLEIYKIEYQNNYIN